MLKRILILTIAVAITLLIAQQAQAASWWDNSYSYRKQITVTASIDALESGYSVNLTFDHAALVAGGKSLSSGNDGRIVYWNGSTNAELDRVLDESSSWNNASTKIWFKTQAAISASSSDNNYYLYYGNSGAGSPPANGDNVYVFYDTFGGASIDTTKWYAEGTYTVSGGILTFQLARIQSKNPISGDFILEERSQAYKSNFTNTGHNAVGLMDSDKAEGDGFWGFYRESALGDNLYWQPYWRNAAGTYTSFTTFDSRQDAVWYRHKKVRAGSNFQWYIDDVQKFSETNANIGANIYLHAPRVWTEYTDGDDGIKIDWILVRKYVGTDSSISTSLGGEEGNPPLSGYVYRKQITVQSLYIDSNLTDFPLYVDITNDADIGSGMTDTVNYYDIRFTDSNNIVLPYECEYMNISGNVATGHYWVRTDLDSSSGATLYVYYGKSGATDGSDAAAVWDGDYKGVWHMGENSGTTTADSTTNNETATFSDTPAWTTGKLAYGLAFDGNDYLSVTVDIGADWTIDTWFYYPLESNTHWRTLTRGAAGDHQIIVQTGAYDLGMYNSGGGAFRDTGYDVNVLSTGWHHLACVGSGSIQTFYIDGSSVGTSDTKSTTDISSIGNFFGGGQSWGTIDEMRISLINRPAQWIKFEYRNIYESDNELTWEGQKDMAANAVFFGITF